MDTNGASLDPQDSPLREIVEQRTLESLDFPAVRERVAECATFEPARIRMSTLKPTFDSEEVERLQQETAEGRRLLVEISELSLHAPGDVSKAIGRAALEGVLTGSELLTVGQTLDVLRRTKASVVRHKSLAPRLATIADGKHDLNSVRVRISDCIGPRGEVMDGATSTLAALRREVREAFEQVTQSLNRLVHSKRGKQALQDQLISIRGDRFVVPVRSEMRRQIPGIVHDASNTGATLYIEPFATVEMGNHWRELALEEEREVLRVLRELSVLVGDMAVEIRSGVQALADIDVILARARYSEKIKGVRPSTSSSDGKLLNLTQARHPLLEGQVVPVSLYIGPEWRALVITGPNTGGKTVAMKTVGLLALMHQSGLQVPTVDGSVLPVFDGVYADVGDRQSIQQSVSTFSSHIRNVVDILGLATSSSLVLLDELGTGTDPEEGAALAKGVLDYLAEREVPTIVTTHHRSVAAFAEASPKMSNASVDLDPNTLQPNYRLTVGIPGRSYALRVAESLRMPGHILKTATDSMEPESVHFETMLSEMEKERALLQEKMKQAEDAAATAEMRAKELQAQLDEMSEQREELQSAMRRDVLAEYDDLRKKLKKAEASLSWASGSSPRAEDVQEASQEFEAVGDEVQHLKKAVISRATSRQAEEPLAKGDMVDIRGLATQGAVVELDIEEGEAEVAIGNIRLRIDLHRLSKVQGKASNSDAIGSGVSAQLGPMLASADLDIRGLRVEDATFRLEEFLDKAVRDGMAKVRVIHGRGTGALREVVREQLGGHPLVRTYQPEEAERGGNGVTVVELT
ncbi:MAG: endonuclease MutS2 [Chloroflexi bacterium]|nr:endonuclease MutS2 [Chloroflexota bacterium]